MRESVHGLINVLKPPGMTSHDVVAFMRRLVERKVGHTGTLDPLAAGVLVITVGAGTRLTDFLAADDKAYRAEIALGIETDTLDFEGTVASRQDAGHIDAEQVREALGALTGQVEMLPPMYSAVKQGGRKLYELARKGREVERKPRRVTVSRFELLRFEAGPEPTCLCEIECSKGTYVRSLAQMLGERLAVGGCLSFLLRTRQGAHALADSFSLEELTALVDGGRLQEAVTPLAKALPALKQVQVAEEQAVLLRSGRAIACAAQLLAGEMVMVVRDGEAVCIAQATAPGGDGQLQPKKVFPAPGGPGK